jgi:hypothetical protein
MNHDGKTHGHGSARECQQRLNKRGCRDAPVESPGESQNVPIDIHRSHPSLFPGPGSLGSRSAFRSTFIHARIHARSPMVS